MKNSDWITCYIYRNILKWRLKLKQIYEKNSNNTSNNQNENSERLNKSRNGENNEEDVDFDENKKLEDELKEALYNEKKIDKKYISIN